MSDLDRIFIGPYNDAHTPGTYRLAVKDNIDLAGRITTAGSRSREHVPPAKVDAPVVAMLRESGRVTVVGKTNLDEFAAGATGENPWFGDVPNPTDVARMTGGSSSGSAVAVATGLADIALGTDTGGSVRIPAALTGLASLKTTHGLVSIHGVHPLSQLLDTVGPIARTVEDLAFVMEHIVPSFAKAAPPQLEASQLRVGRLRFTEPETEIDTIIDGFLNSAGISSEDLRLDAWGDAHGAAFSILAFQAWHNNIEHIRKRPDDIGAIAGSVLEVGANLSTDGFAEALAFQRRWSAEIETLFTEFDVLICPTVSTFAPKLSDLAQLDWSTFSRTMQFNLSGHPALNLPLHAPGSPLTLGIQMIGALGADAALLHWGRELEGRILEYETSQISNHPSTKE